MVTCPMMTRGMCGGELNTGARPGHAAEPGAAALRGWPQRQGGGGPELGPSGGGQRLCI